MSLFTDQTGQTITLSQPPSRIISVVPSQTELLAHLGLDNEVVGITKFCIHPDAWFRSKTRIGGTKQVKMELVHRLKPDLVIANKEENVKEQVEELAAHYPVWTSDINNLEDAYDMIMAIGQMTGKPGQALKLAEQVKNNFARLPPPLLKPRTAYLIWRDPLMTVGRDTFIHAMLKTAGFENIFADRLRYPETSVDDLRNNNCELLLLSSEPFPFAQKHIDELQPLLPNTRIMLVDGEMFSWYGSRLLKAPAYFEKLHAVLSRYL